jgi:hypothetical protein
MIKLRWSKNCRSGVVVFRDAQEDSRASNLRDVLRWIDRLGW